MRTTDRITLNGAAYIVTTDTLGVDVYTAGRVWLGSTDLHGQAIGLRLPSDEQSVCNAARTVLAQSPAVSL